MPTTSPMPDLPYEPDIPWTVAGVTRGSFRYAYRWWIRNWRKFYLTVTNNSGKELYTPYLEYNGGRLHAGDSNITTRLVLPGDYGAARRLWKRFLADTDNSNGATPRIIVAGYNEPEEENEQNGGQT